MNEIKGRSDVTTNDGLWSGLEQNHISNDSNTLLTPHEPQLSS